MSPRSTRLGGAVAVVTLLAMWVHPSSANQRSSDRVVAAKAFVSLAPSTGPPTTVVRLTASGFVPNQPVEVFFDTVDVDAAVTAGSGELTNLGLQVPVSAAPGNHWVTVVDLSLGTAAQARFLVSQPWRESGSGNSRTGLNPYENLITPLNASSLIRVGSGLTGGAVESSAAVASGASFVGSDDGRLYNFPLTGCRKSPCLPVWVGATGGPVTSSPAVANGVAYVGSQDGRLYAYSIDCSSGGGSCTPLWTGQSGGPMLSSPAASTYVYVGSDDGRLYAFPPSGCGASTCSPVWTAMVGGAARSSPAVAWGRVYVGSTNGSVYAFDAGTGGPSWVAATGGSVTSSPAISGFVLYVGSQDGKLYAFNTGCGTGGAQCSPLWTGATGGVIESSPAAGYGDVFVGSDDGKLYAFRASGCAAATCSPLWVASTGGPLTSSPAIAGGVVFVGSSDGRVYAFNARSGTQLWSFDLGSPIVASPVISDGFVEVGATNGALYLFRIGAYPRPPPKPAISSLVAPPTPIRHVVVIDQENHSFDNVLGALCVQDARCDGATSGTLPDGSTVSLATAPDLVPLVDHSLAAQTLAIDDGKMDGFSLIDGCEADTGYACYSQYQPSQVPAEAALARTFTVSDRTFEDGAVPSWGQHLDLVTAQLDGFTGDNPWPAPPGQGGPGWGCDSNATAAWSDGGPPVFEPSCVPRPDGSGPFRPSPVAWVPSIMDRLDAASRTWRVYAGGTTVMGSGYLWAACPTLAECIYGPQVNDLVASSRILADAAAGALPAVSFVQPSAWDSQHNGYSMAAGDNWVSSVVSAIENGPQWSSTAIFITEDDCGCFYDHVPPPPGLGIRVPVLIVSPYAKPGFTDSTVASFASFLAYTEHLFGLSPLSTGDAGAYDYAQSFDYGQRPRPPIELPRTHVPASEIHWIKTHLPDPSDPT